MANVRIAQTGQTAVNKPFWEVIVNNKRFCFATNDNGQVQFKPRSFLFSLGVCSVVCKTYEETLSPEARQSLGLDLSGSTSRDNFPAQTIGTGLAYVADFSVFSGWKNLYPSGSLVYQF